jgi:hypothetical protein
MKHWYFNYLNFIMYKPAQLTTMCLARNAPLCQQSPLRIIIIIIIIIIICRNMSDNNNILVN